MHAFAVFQRSDSGRHEIQHKTHGLTQSERLVLILIDGSAPVSAIHEMLKGLSSERLDRAFDKLHNKQLIVEVLLVMPGMQAEIVDPLDVARFLHQDPLDPVTIVAFNADSEYELELFGESSQPVVAGANPSGASPSALLLPHSINATHGLALPLTSVDFYIPLEKKSGGVEVFTMEERLGIEEDALSVGAATPTTSVHLPWGLALMAAGVVVLVVSVGIKLMI